MWLFDWVVSWFRVDTGRTWTFMIDDQNMVLVRVRTIMPESELVTSILLMGTGSSEEHERPISLFDDKGDVVFVNNACPSCLVKYVSDIISQGGVIVPFGDLTKGDLDRMVIRSRRWQNNAEAVVQ